MASSARLEGCQFAVDPQPVPNASYLEEFVVDIIVSHDNLATKRVD